MNHVICVANYDTPQRLQNFCSSLAKCNAISMARVIIINTSNYNKEIDKISEMYLHNFVVFQLNIDRQVSPAEQVKIRIERCAPYCNDDTIYHAFDDDYVFNPHWLQFCDQIFGDNPNVKILSLLKQIPGDKYVVGNHIVENNIKLSGFRFARVRSSMGGGVSYRWKDYKPMFDEFLTRYNINNQYDSDIWHIAREQLGEGPIYMSQQWSLYQHCDLVSQYGHHTVHSYGHDFDPCVNPFEAVKYLA